MDAPTFRHEWAKFRDHHVAEGNTMANWHAAWGKWVRGWIDRGSKPIGVNGHRARAGPARSPEEIRDPMVAAVDRYMRLNG